MVERLSQYRTYRKQLHLLVSALAVALFSCLLTACDMPVPLGFAQATVIPTVTVVPSVTTHIVLPTQTSGGPVHLEKQAFMTRIAETRVAYRTVVALTGIPTHVAGPPPTYATYTPVLGMLGAEPDFSKNPNNPYISSSWRGWINGGIVQVDAGSEGNARDPLQGVLIVSVWSTHTTQTYNTPYRIGPVRLVAVDGMRVTLIPAELSTPGVLLTPWATTTPGFTFVFDLATRKWISPASNLGPFPTETPWPGRPTEHGKIYDKSLEDDPVGKYLSGVNYWIGHIGGYRTVVYAGHIKDRPDQGVIIVRTYTIDEYETATQVGALRLLDETSGRLSLRAADNSLLYFDLITRQWVSSPPPSYYPPPTYSDPELQQRYQIREATRVAILTTVPQETIGPNWYPTPIVWNTPFPISTNVLYPAGAGMILEDGQAGLPSAIGSFKNQWHRETDGIYTTVYAGSDKFQRSQGLVVVEVTGMNTSSTTQLYHTPLQFGPVRVTAATGELLTLQAENGTLFYFDVPTRQWVNP